MTAPELSTIWPDNLAAWLNATEATKQMAITRNILEICMFSSSGWSGDFDCVFRERHGGICRSVQSDRDSARRVSEPGCFPRSPGREAVSRPAIVEPDCGL